MIERSLNQMRVQSRLAMSNVAYSKFGTIANYNPDNYTVTVTLRPEDPDNPERSLTGWIPYAALWGGNGWGLFAPPTLGDQCSVHFVEGSYDGAFATAVFFNQNLPPQNVPSGEFWLVHQAGATLKFTNDGNVTLSSTDTITVDAPTVNIGNISAGSLEKLLNSVAQSVYNGHTHPQSGGGDTGAPTQQMGSSSLTTALEAN